MLFAGVANPEMTFGGVSEAPVPKRRRKAIKAGSQPSEGQPGAALQTSPSGAQQSDLASEAADSEPAELMRAGAADVVADADLVASKSRGMIDELYSFTSWNHNPWFL